MNISKDFKELIKENGQLDKELSSVHSKYLKSNKGILEALTKIAFIQYVRSDYENALLVVDMLSKIPFNYDYDYWTWVEYAIALRAEISTLNGDTNKLEDSLGIINAVLNSGEGLQKKIRINVHNRFMHGETIEINKSLALADHENKYEEFNYRIIYLMALIKIKILGGSEVYPLGKIISDIKNNVELMQGLIKKDVIRGVEPYK